MDAGGIYHKNDEFKQKCRRVEFFFDILFNDVPSKVGKDPITHRAMRDISKCRTTIQITLEHKSKKTITAYNGMAFF